MPRTATKSDVSKRSREVKASPILTDEDIKVAARRTASRAAKKGEDWTAAYIKAWRRMSGMKNRPAGPVA